jgi:DNA-binding NarL/FixJ family response regulator
MRTGAGTEGAISVAIVEDHAALRRGMELLLEGRGYRVLGAAGDADRGLRLIRRERPDVSVVDLGLPDGSGSGLVRRLLEDEPGLGVLVYTGLAEERALREALACGARGVATKAGPPEELASAIDAVADGRHWIDPRLRGRRSLRISPRRLTPREREVLGLLADGLTGEEAAQKLFLSPETIRTHVRNAMDKLGAKTRAHAITIALRDGQIGA